MFFYSSSHFVLHGNLPMFIFTNWNVAICSFFIKFTIAMFALDTIIHLSFKLLKLSHFLSGIVSSLWYRSWSTSSYISTRSFAKWFFSLLASSISIYSWEAFLWGYLLIKLLTGLHCHSKLHWLQLPFIWNLSFRLYFGNTFIWFPFFYFHFSDCLFLLGSHYSLGLGIEFFSFFYENLFANVLMLG